ncbi:hypothetical protein IV203_005879 [Nitzschia inconspicua]|uniref:Uncharacterized protein n=1 Tax=Nitzschia inconspicua TaxID=303405 RepID=A0A9K3PGY1_9STRA|nr:hypothetical protein IV203_005879 [Nitzschia inconspicua]
MPLQVQLTICKNDGNAEEVTPHDARMSKSLAHLDFQDADDDTKLFNMTVESSGKYSRKATWEDLTRYTGQEMTPEVFVDWIVNYQAKCFPEDLEKPFHIPKKCYIRDENGGTIYKDFGWKPIKLNLVPGYVDTKERWTKEVCLESFPLDYSTSLEQILLQQGDKKITSTLRKSKLAGHALAMEMMKTDSEITTEFRGIESVAFGVLGNRAGVTREAKVLANESYLKARVYYKCYFSNDVATDHEGKFDGKPYWKFPMKYLLQYNGMPKQVVVYEDIELRFFTDIRVAMDNKDWEWVKDENGRWKKQFASVSTSVSRRKSDGDKQLKDNMQQAIDECDEGKQEKAEDMQEKGNDTSTETAKTEETSLPEDPTETENSELAAVEKENTIDMVVLDGELHTSCKDDPDGTILDDSVGRMCIGEPSLEP